MQHKRRTHSRRISKKVLEKTILLLAGSAMLLVCLGQGFVQLSALVRESDEQKSKEMLSQITNAGEMLVQEVLKSTENLVNDSDLANFGHGSRRTEAAVEKLAKTVGQSTVLEDIRVVSPGKNISLTSKGEMNPNEAVAMLTEWSLAALHKPGRFNGSFRLLSLADRRGQEYSTVAFMRPVLDENAVQVGTILILLKRDRVNILNGAFMLSGQYNMHWIDSENHVIYSSDTARKTQPPTIAALKENVAVYGHGRERHTYSVGVHSPRKGFAYVLTAQNTARYDRLWKVYAPVLLGLCFLLAADVYIFLHYIKRQTRAINNSLQVLSQKGIIDLQDEENESLDRIVVKLVAEREVLTDKLARYRSMDLDNKLGKIFSGAILPDASFYLPYSRFAVCAVSVNNRSVFSDDKSINAQEEKALIKLVVDNVLNEKYICYSRYANDTIFCLLNFDESGDLDASAVVAGEMQVLSKVCEDELELIFVGSMSSPGDSTESIGTLYKECLRAQEYAKIKSLRLVSYEEVEKDIKAAENMTNYYQRLLEKEQIVIKNCNPWSYRHVCAAVDDFEKLLFGSAVDSFEKAKAKCVDLFKALAHILRHSNSTDTYTKDSELEDLQELNLCNTGEQIQVFFEVFLEKMNGCIANSQEEKKDYFTAKVESILEKKYSDMDLSVSMIADELKMPMRLVSSQYKQKTGCGLLDRINSFRVEKAKEMLVNSEDSVYEIAERCGYENVNTFIRVFRKYTGQTPGRYRSE